ncbi:tripartite tricarboxylate transporter TctB family protein [Pokkaliibacter sp. CJK22405]|uniref:tripartite tricarboxylate transporter TctB family protein n=1 Tax=Pokkaliibacter sp. CJK22405 TaxID=3384615 RepID=UPI0039847A15
MLLNDRIFGLVMLVLAIAYGYGATLLPEPFGGNEVVGPKDFPLLLAWLTGICSLYLMFKPSETQPWPSARVFAELIIVLMVLFAFAWALETLGFIIASLVCVGLLCWRMGATPLSAALTGLGSGVGIFVIFNYLLELPLPLGILGG